MNATATPMYRHKDIVGCVIEEFRAVQVTAKDVFGVDQINQIQRVFPEFTDDRLLVEFGGPGKQQTIVILSATRPRIVEHRIEWSDYLFQDSDGQYHVLPRRAFEDTFEVSR